MVSETQTVSDCLNVCLVLGTGVSMDDIKVEQAECDLDDRVYWLVSFPDYFLP